MSALKGAGTGASIGANPLLVGATAGLSIPIGAAVGAIGGGLIGHNSAEKAAKQNHDALMQQYYPDAFANGGRISYADGGNLDGDPKKTPEYQKYLHDKQMYNDSLQLSEIMSISHKDMLSGTKVEDRGINPVIDKYIDEELLKFRNNPNKVLPSQQVSFNRLTRENKKNPQPLVNEIVRPDAITNTRLNFTIAPQPWLNKRYTPPKIKPTFDGEKYIPEFIPKTADALQSRNANLSVNPPINNRQFYIPNIPDEPSMGKFYLGLDDKQEALRQQGKPYQAKNAQGHIINIVSGDKNIRPDLKNNQIPEERIGYDRGEAKGLYALGGQMGNTPNIENQFGNQMSEFKGAKHTEGGIQLGQNAEVEAGEVKWKDYIFSDQLTPENKDATFASIAKRIKNKYKGRENDKKANQALEAELSRLSAENDIQKQKHEQETMNSHINDLKTYGNHVQMGEDGNPQYSDGGKLELIKGARKAGLSLDQFVTHLSNAKVKYANGGDWKFQQFEDSPITNTGDFRGSTANYGIGDYNYTDDRDFTTTAGAEDYPRFNNTGNYPIKPRSGSFSSVDYNTGEVFPHDISTGRSVTKQDFTQPSTASFDGSSYLPKELQNQQLDGINTFGSMQSRTPDMGVKNANELPQSQMPDTSTYDKFLDESLLKDRNRNTGTGNSKFGYAEAGLMASNIAGVDNLIKSMKPAQTNFERVKFDRLNLQQARDLNARDSALGQRMTQANVRNNATSSGQALSNLAASNAALTEGRIKADMSTYLQEEQANTGITNQERGLNNQISREEYIANEQNKANAQSVGNFALANMGQNTQMYGRDKVLTQADVMSNKRYMDVLNTIAPNYQWNVDPESDKLMISYISKLANK